MTTRRKPTVLPYGSWPSPISAVSLVQGAAQISKVVADPVRAGLLWWSESRPDEGGRTAVMCCNLNISAAEEDPARASVIREVTPKDTNVRTRVHEYGGGAWWPHDGVLYYVDFGDQRLRRLDPNYTEPIMLTGEPEIPAGLRYADGRVTPDGRWFICVRERHEPASGGEPVNELVAVATDGSQRVEQLWADSDFVMSPRISSDGNRLAWISWDHPNMPWDATRLHVHELGDGRLGSEVVVVGLDRDRSLCQPGWVASTAGTATQERLLTCSDHENWWGLYEVDLTDGGLLPLVVGEFEVGTPPWVFGMQRWAASAETLVAVAGKPSGDVLLVNGQPVAMPDSSITSLTMVGASSPGESQAHGSVTVAYAGAGFGHETEVVTLTVAADAAPPRRAAIRSARSLGFDKDLLVTPEAITYPTTPMVPSAPESATAPTVSPVPIEPPALTVVPAPTELDVSLSGSGAQTRSQTKDADVLFLGSGAQTRSQTKDADVLFLGSGAQTRSQTKDADVNHAHALYYPPANPACVGPEDERPPLMVLAHGGPTAAARRQLQLGILYWTSRGFAVVDVDYRGSTGYGRRYRQALNGAWGVADVSDCVSAARFLADRGEVDPNRLVIRGGSAGGFTVLAALANHDMFAAGASSYGVADLEVLAADTHKFESRYLDTLIGPWPEARKTYAERSPIRHLDSFNAPMIVLQGSDDEIVPPNQSEMIVEALEAKGVGVAYLLFEGEQHGFRRAENIVTALESELAFFAEVLGFEAADDLSPITIRGLTPPHDLRSET